VRVVDRVPVGLVRRDTFTGRCSVRTRRDSGLLAGRELDAADIIQTFRVSHEAGAIDWRPCVSEPLSLERTGGPHGGGDEGIYSFVPVPFRR
jgi:hypothetical protein